VTTVLVGSLEALREVLAKVEGLMIGERAASFEQYLVEL
jgi:hypothetical protein